MIGSLLNAQASRKTERLIVLGASGSVGTTALNFLKTVTDIVPVGISIHTSITRLREILSEFSIPHVAITDADVYTESIGQLKRDFPTVRFYSGESGCIDMIYTAGADTVLTAMVGASGIRATMAAFSLGMKVALANKETMVTAGPAIEESVKRNANRPVIIPVDSEHNGVFQLLLGVPDHHLNKIYLTASGGPFREMAPERIKTVTREEVLNHPTWAMGAKITVDSAGMINKGLEVIEAHYLFSVPYEKLAVLIHKNSFIHAMVETIDGGFLMAGSTPNMVFPVAHALYYPDAVSVKHPHATAPDAWPDLCFEPVNLERYPGFRLCVEAGKSGGTAPAILNAANEVAVASFLAGIIEFTDIPPLIEMVLAEIPIERGVELDLFLEADRRARQLAEKKIKTFR